MPSAQSCVQAGRLCAAPTFFQLVAQTRVWGWAVLLGEVKVKAQGAPSVPALPCPCALTPALTRPAWPRGGTFPGRLLPFLSLPRKWGSG